MKTKPKLLISASLGALIGGVLTAVAVPPPTGKINVSRDLVRSGVMPLVSWEIMFPQELEDMMSLSPESLNLAKQDLNLTVRVLGAGYTTIKSNNGHGNNIDGVDYSNPGKGGGGPNGEIDTSAPVDDEIRLNGNGKISQAYLDAFVSIQTGGGSGWESVYDGSVADLEASEVYYQGTVNEGDTFRFAAAGRAEEGRGKKGRRTGSGWYPVVSTGTSSGQVIALKNGDPLPTEVSSFSTGEIEAYLSSYVSDNGTMVLGPREVIYLFDLDGEPGASNFSLQDLGIHVLVEPRE